MTNSEYAEKCIVFVAFLREASADDAVLAELLKMFDLLQEPAMEGPACG